MWDSMTGVSQESLYESGFDGWWDPVDKLFGYFLFYGTPILLITQVPWDSRPNGRLDIVHRFTSRLNKGRVQFFSMILTP